MITTNAIINLFKQQQDDAYLTFKSIAPNTAIALNKVGNPSSLSAQYKLGSNDWTDYTIGNVIAIPQNSKLKFRGNYSAGLFSTSNYYQFAMSGLIQSSGELSSLYNKDTLVTYQYWHLFENCSALITAPKLSHTVLAQSCYNSMFKNCTNLITPPQMKITVAYYWSCQQMFMGCTSLTNAPILSATTVYNSCYYQMFQGCTSLSSVPELPATTLDTSCYGYMFQGCTSLSSTPELPATNLANSCYQSMFQGCTNLTTPPSVLPALSSYSYSCLSMFNGCTSLSSAPIISATTFIGNGSFQAMFMDCRNLTDGPYLPAKSINSYTYTNMFYRCSNLSSIAVALTGWVDDGSNNWLGAVKNNGTFRCPASLPQVRGTGNIPNNWTIEREINKELTFKIGVDYQVQFKLQNNKLVFYDHGDDPGMQDDLPAEVNFGYKALLVDDVEWDLTQSEEYSLPFIANEITKIELINVIDGGESTHERGFTKTDDLHYDDNNNNCHISVNIDDDYQLTIIDRAFSSAQYIIKIYFN